MYVFDLDMMSMCDSETAVFNPGVFKELDSIKHKINVHMATVNKLASVISTTTLTAERWNMRTTLDILLRSAVYVQRKFQATAV